MKIFYHVVNIIIIKTPVSFSLVFFLDIYSDHHSFSNGMFICSSIEKVREIQQKLEEFIEALKNER